MEWKKILCLLLSAGMCLALVACTGGEVPAEEIQPPEEEETGPAYWFETSDTADKYSDDEGRLLASYDYQIVVMKTSEQADAAVLEMAENFNAGMQEVLDNQLEMGDELGQWASYDDNLSPSLGTGDSYYTDELTVEGTQTGEIYSACFSNYNYMGGAHPSQTYFSRTFDLNRGEYIDPLEVADDPELLRATVTDLLLDQIQHLDPEILAGYYEGYESTVSQWNSRSVCFGAEGMTVVFSEYELGPYVLGTQTFTIHYEELAEALGQGGQVKLGLAEPESTAAGQTALAKREGDVHPLPLCFFIKIFQC